MELDWKEQRWKWVEGASRDASCWLTRRVELDEGGLVAGDGAGESLGSQLRGSGQGEGANSSEGKEELHGVGHE